MTRLTDEQVKAKLAQFLNNASLYGSETRELLDFAEALAEEILASRDAMKGAAVVANHSGSLLREKDARIAELEAALAKAKETADAEFTAKLRYRDERMAAEAEVKRLREALEYYASQYCESPGFDGCGECEPHDCDGCRARAALGREG